MASSSVVRSRVALGFVLAASLLACSSGETEGSPTEAVLAESFVANAEADPNSLQFDGDEADCVAREVVAAIPVGRLEELGLDVDAGGAPDLHEPPLTAGEADAVFVAYQHCIDLAGQLADVVASDGSLTAEQAACVGERYVESGILREALFAAFDEELNARIDEVLEFAYVACTT